MRAHSVKLTRWCSVPKTVVLNMVDKHGYFLCLLLYSCCGWCWVVSTMTWYPTQPYYPGTEPTSPCSVLLILSAWLGCDKYQFERYWFDLTMARVRQAQIPQSPKIGDGRSTHSAIPSALSVSQHWSSGRKCFRYIAICTITFIWLILFVVLRPSNI